MSRKRALQIIFAIALFGVAFSGYLSYGELFSKVPPAQSCPALGKPGTVLGYPACVYGFFMYLLISGVASAGLRSKGGAKSHRSLGQPGSPAVAPGTAKNAT